MTDTTALEDVEGVTVEEAEPLDDETGDSIELVRSGWVRFRIDGKLVRFRRPFFGELKRLRLALEEMTEAVGDLADDTQREALAIVRELGDSAARDAEGEVDLGDEERIERRMEAKRRSKAAARKLTDFAETERIRWWRLVAETLGVGDELPSDDELPGWIVDSNLPHRVMTHWRSVPLGRG